MPLPIRDQLRYWGIATVLLLVTLYFLGNVMLPFLVGGAIAYFLDPVADRLERAGLSRIAATSIIAVIAVLVVVTGGILIIPALINQGIALVDAAPDIFAQLQTFLEHQFPQIVDEQSTLRQSLGAIGTTIQARGAELIEGLLGSALGVVGAVVFIVVVPVVAFYMLLDWDNMLAKIDGWLPRDHALTIRKLAREIDDALAGFVRGQLTVCGILAAFYAVALMLVGLQFGLVVGAITGMISFIPYVGAIIGGMLAIGLALFQFWGQPFLIGLVVAIFVIGQVIEGNFLVPYLVGVSVGLHPLWLLFALSAFGAMFGFVGLLVAVPVAAAMGVLFRFAVSQYTDSVLYRGLGSQLVLTPDDGASGTTRVLNPDGSMPIRPSDAIETTIDARIEGKIVSKPVGIIDLSAPRRRGD